MYYKMWQKIVTICDKYYKMKQEVITKCENYYKIRRNCETIKVRH